MSFEARNQNVFDLFSRALYHIPRNQRRYVWEKRNWQELFEDVSLVVDDTFSSHFIGSIVLIDDGRKEGLPNYVIIDGQQRIVTLTVIISCIMFWFKRRQLSAEFEGIKQYVLAKSDTANDSVMVTSEYQSSLEKIIRYIVDIDASRAKDISLTALIDYPAAGNHKDKAIIDAFKFYLMAIRDKIESMDDPDSYLKRLRDSVVGISYVSIIASTNEDAYTIFEILNARGLELEDHELLKNYIMRYIHPDSSRDSAKHSWIEMENVLGNEISKFVEHYAIHRYGNNRGVSNYKIIQNANKGKNTTELLDDLRKKASYYTKLVSPSQGDNCTDVEYKVFSFFKKKRQVQMRTVLMSLIHLKEQDILNEKKYEGLISFLYNFYVCYYIIGEERSNNLTGVIYKYAEIIENRYSEEILNEFILDLQKKIPEEESFINAFRNVGWSHSGGFFEGSKNKDRVQTVLEVIERFKQPSGNFTDDFTIEHILPDSATPENAQIGNLIPLEDILNQRCNGIEYYEGDKDRYLSEKYDIYADSKYAMARRIKKNYGGKTFQIKERTDIMAKELYNKILNFKI